MMQEKDKILDKDKLYIVIYYGVLGIDVSDVSSHIADISKHITFDDSVIKLIVPNPNSNETKIEFFNNEILSKLNSEKINQLVDNFNKMSNEWRNNYGRNYKENQRKNR